MTLEAVEARPDSSSLQQALGLLRLGAPLVLGAAALDGGFALFLMAVQAFFPDRLHAGAASPGYALALYGGTRVLLQGPAGLLARRFGTGRQIVFGMAGGALALAALALAANPIEAYLLTLLYGVTTALAWPAIFLRAGDQVDDARGELISYLTLCAMAAMVGCMAVGAFMVDYIPARLVVAGAAAFLAAGTLPVAALLRRQGVVRSRRAPGRAGMRHAGTRPESGMVRLFAALLLQGLGLAMLTPVLRQYARQQLHLQLHDLILLGIPAAVCAGATFLVAGRLTDRIGRAPVVAGGTVVAGLGTLLMAAANGRLLFALGVAPLAVGYAASAPALGAWITDLTSESGGSVGLALTVQGVALALGPALTGFIVSTADPAAAIRVASLFWLAAAACTVRPVFTRAARLAAPAADATAGPSQSESRTP